METALIVVAWVLSVLLAVFVGGFLKSYMSKKGENLATHEDINKLVDQVRAVTITAKEIEAKISSDVWDRQKRWELRRDILFEIARKVGRSLKAIENLYAIYNSEKIGEREGRSPRMEKRAEAFTDWNNAAAEFDGLQILASASCGKDLIAAVLEFGAFTRQLANRITEGQPEAFMSSAEDLVRKMKDITLAIRKELEIPQTA